MVINSQSLSDGKSIHIALIISLFILIFTQILDVVNKAVFFPLLSSVFKNGTDIAINGINIILLFFFFLWVYSDYKK